VLGTAIIAAETGKTANSTTADDETIIIDAVTVTGSNIKGVNTEKTLPITVVTADEVRDTGISSMAELVESMPYSTNVSINEASTGPNDARGDVSTINLRNMGASRTLVLLNGRRMSAYGVTPGTPPVQFVNINSIPLGAIQQVEVLRDGASAIYGSDALGGVVNTILKKNYEGFESNVRYAFGDKGSEETSVDISGGTKFNKGKSSITVSFGFYDRDGIMAADRVYAADADKTSLVGAPFNTNTSFNRRSSSGPTGRFTAVNDSGTAVSVSGVTGSTGTFYYDPTTGVRKTGSGTTAFYNSQNNTQLIPDTRRYNLFTALDHKLSSGLSLFGEYSFYKSESSGGFDSIPISSATDGIVVPKTNYYSPVGTNSGVTTPYNVLIRNYRVVEAGPRTYDTDSDSHRIITGLRGDIGQSTWTWETAGLYMRGHTKQVNHGYISQSKFIKQLGLSTADAYNPFAPGTNPASVVNNFLIDIWDDGVGTLSSWDAKASGELFNMPGGPVSLAIGSEFRRETMKQRNDPYGLADDVVAQSEQLDVDAGRNVSAGYSEIVIPLVGDKNHVRLVNSLELRAAARYEHYKGFDATKPGTGLSWRPFKWMLLRASYNEGFRAPSVSELYTPAVGRRNEGYIDTARKGQADAVSSVTKRIVTGGNPDLLPEESKSYNAGIVLDIPALKGFSVGADFYRIRQTNQIDNPSAQTELDLDAALWAAGHGSNPRVIRAAQTATDIAAGLPGTLIEVQGTYKNQSLRETEGVDLSLNYRTPKLPIGRLTFTNILTYTSKLRTVDASGNTTYLIRNDGNPRMKASFGLGWNRGAWSANILERFVDDYQASSAYTTSGVPFVVGQYWVTNFNLGYSFRSGRLAGLKLRLGVNNAFDRNPPFYPASSSGYDSSYADPRGRMLFSEVSYKF
jgi:outer membrane receptor protein involved in Fe transport